MCGLFLAPTLLASSTSAPAQIAASVAVDTDFRFRGSSLSRDRPVASANLAYDRSSGIYLNASATGTRRDGNIALLNMLGNIGYAKRLSPSVSFDMGLLHSRYRWGDLPNTSSSRTEAYVGLTANNFATRVSYSPHYFERGMAVVYAEAEAGFRPLENWRVTARAGVLHFLRAPGDINGSSRYDWRFGVSRQFGAAEAYTAISGGGPNRGNHGKTALTAGASLNF